MDPGQTLSHYRILEKLGAGGMGEVYKALDTKLNRTVAIKVLPTKWISNPELRQRFAQEAQAASALDHPNIVTIHDIVEAEGQYFIVMQYVKGQTLRHLVGERLEVSRSLDVAVQIADGLNAAHAAGIVHRDLKPENIIVDDRGQVKILDFGLAKLTEPSNVHEAETRDQVHLTRAGHILGTVAYMSPEHTQGRSVDTRSDIFSFGSLLYEILTGKPAFAGEDTASVMAAILRDDPPSLGDVLTQIPPGLDALIKRALEKDPARRFSSMGDVKIELESVRTSLRTTPLLSARGRRWLGAAAVAVTIGMLFYALRDRLPPSSPSLPPPRVVPVTSYPGVESCPVVSPDGSRVAFLMSADVFVQNISGGRALQLTETSAEEISLAWTPDSQEITFVRATDSGHEICSVPALGGAETRVTRLQSMVRIAFGLSWSPDRKHLAHVDNERTDLPQAIYLFDMATGTRTRLTQPLGEYVGDVSPVYSPEGDKIAFVRMTTTHVVRDIYVKDLTDEEEIRVTTENRSLSFGFDWTGDGHGIVYSLSGDLYLIGAFGGEPRLVEGVDGHAGWPSVSRDGSFLVYQRSSNDWNIWRVPGPRNQDGEPKRLIESTRLEHTPVYSPDGSSIAFVSNRGGSIEIWLCDSDGSNPRPLTSFDEYADRPNWSPNGEEIVFDARLEGNTDVYRVSAAGGVPTRLTKEPSVDGAASWSRDGKWIYFMSDRTGSRQIWKMTGTGERAIQLSQDGGWQPLESFGAAFVYFARTEGGVGIWRLPSSGGEEELVLEGVYPHRWDLTEDGIVYIHETKQVFELFDFASNERTSFASPPGPLFTRGGGLSVSRDGRWLLYPQNDAPGTDLVMLENFR